MQVFIVEDERIARESLELTLQSVVPDAHIVGNSDNVKSAIEQIVQVKPDLIFLDIKLKDGNAFEILEELERIDSEYYPQIIITTAYDDFLLEAIHNDVIDYLTKPISAVDLLKAIERFKKRSRQLNQKNESRFLRENQNDYERKIGFSGSDGFSIYNSDEILYLKAEGNYSKVFPTQNKPFLMGKTLKFYEQNLRNKGFVRIHSSYLINLTHVTRYLTKDGGGVVLAGKILLPVSQRKRSEVMNRLKNLTGNN